MTAMLLGCSAGDLPHPAQVQACTGHRPLPTASSVPADGAHHAWPPGPHRRGDVPCSQQVCKRSVLMAADQGGGTLNDWSVDVAAALAAAAEAAAAS